MEMFTSEDIMVLNDAQGAEGYLLDKINEHRGIALDNIDPNGDNNLLYVDSGLDSINEVVEELGGDRASFTVYELDGMNYLVRNY